jgi:two-component system sensor histidine kinase GlrK
MPRFRPKSFFALVLLAMLTVSVPLIGVLVASDLLMDRLVHDSSRSVYRSVTASQLSQSLQEEITNQERRLRQYQVLGDPGLYDEILTGIAEINKTLTNLMSLPPGDESKSLLVRLSDREKMIVASFQPATSPPTTTVNDEDFRHISDLGRQIYQMSLNGIYHEVQTLSHEEWQAEKLLLILASTCLPLTILLVFALSRMITRPIKQINQGIHLLGQGEFNTEITVGGPADLVFLGQRLNWLRQKLSRYEEEKNKFASHISHELKTPLASIHEAAELLGDEIAGPVTDEQREVIEILRKNCGQLNKLIENLVGITMAQAEKNGLRLSAFSLDTLINEVLTAHRPAIINNRLDLRTTIAPLTITADWDRLKTVMDNLLSNAIKYTPAEGTITISAGRLEDKAIIEVQDSGPGIIETEREEIFSPFFQGSAEYHSHVKGTGLGLAIAREYITAHNGTLELARLDEPGTCFRLTLPLSS